MLREHNRSRAVVALRVREAEEGIEEVVSHGRVVQKGILGLREPKEVVEGGKETIDLLENCGSAGGAVEGRRTTEVSGGAEGADLVMEEGEDGVGAVGEAGGPGVLCLCVRAAATGGAGARAQPWQGDGAAKSGDRFGRQLHSR